MTVDWKTTLTSIIAGLATVLSHFGIIFPETWQGIIIAVGVVLLGYFSRDSKKD